MSFPTNPTNGQTTIVNGITYVYSRVKSAWNRQTSFTSSNLIASGNVNLLGNVTFSTNPAHASVDMSTRTDGIILPVGNSAQRPTAINGTLRYNNQTQFAEYYANGTWNILPSSTTLSNIQYLYANNVINSSAVSANVTLGGNILINGTGFSSADSVFVNGILSTCTIVSPTQIIAVLPNLVVGVTTVTVAPYVSNQANILYIQAPTWTGTSPTFTYLSTISYNLTNNVTLGITGDTVTFALTSGALPTGISLNANGLIYGTDVYAGNYNFGVVATDKYGINSVTNVYSGNIALPTIPMTPTTIGSLTQASAMANVTLVGTGGASPYTYAVTSGALPANITLSSSGTVYGTPTGYGSYTFAVTATDAHGYAGQPQTFTGTITQIKYLVTYHLVAGGGGGASNWGGGGGAGGLVNCTTTLTIGTAYTITVGAGGAGGGNDGTNGCNSSITGAPLTPTSYVAIGGGGGGANQSGSSADAGKSGGSGGGGSGWPGGAAGGGGATQPSSPSGGFGNGGGSGSGGASQAAAGGGGGAGGGGATATPNNGGAGGAGKQYSQYAPNYGVAPGSPSYTGAGWFAGGGGGGGNISGGGSGGPATAGGGGGGNNGGGGTGTSGTGGGGGGGGPCGRGGGSGGSGIAFISYANPSQRGSGGSVFTYNPGSGTVYVHAFTGSGSYTA
jgi:hypothetical protein